MDKVHNCDLCKDGYCYSADMCAYQHGPDLNICGIYEKPAKEEKEND